MYKLRQWGSWALIYGREQDLHGEKCRGKESPEGTIPKH